MPELVRAISAWNGIPLWGLFFVTLITLIKTWPLIQKNLFDARDRRESRYSIRIRELEEAVRLCQKECEEHKQELHNKIMELNNTMLGQRRQHVQEQISLISAIIRSVDNPMLKQLLNSLETVQRALPELQELGGVEGDAKGG